MQISIHSTSFTKGYKFDTIGVMNNDYTYKELGANLKNMAKALGVTQAKIAKDLGVSVPTVKRWYAGQSLTIRSVQNISEYLGLSLGELFTSIENKKNTFEYTLKQENYLAKNPDLLAFFDQLIRGKSVKQIKNQFSINEHKLSSILLGLDRIKLIELHENNKVKLLKSGEPSWKKDGPLSKRFRTQITNDFLGRLSSNESSFFMHEYLKEDMNTIKSKFEELKKHLVLVNKRASKSDKEKISIGTYLAFKKFDWDLKEYLK